MLDTEYKQMNDFKKRVLDPSINQINDKTDIKVKVEQHKTGRTISGFSFKFKQKQTAILKKLYPQNEIKHARLLCQNDRCSTPLICT